MNSKKKNNLIMLVLFIIFILLTLCIYFVLVKKDNKEDKPLEIKKMLLEQYNKEVIINDNKYNMKLIDSTLYINDKKIDNIFFEGNIYVTNKYVLISMAGQCGDVINYAIDEDGKVIEVYKNIVLPTEGDNLSFAVNNIRVEDGKAIADLPVQCYCFETEDHKCSDEIIKVEFVYDSKNVNIKKLA